MTQSTRKLVTLTLHGSAFSFDRYWLPERTPRRRPRKGAHEDPPLEVDERVKIGNLDVDRLASFQDGAGKSYTYSYTPSNPLPVAVQSYGQPVMTYQWDESGALPRLLSCTTSFATYKNNAAIWQFMYSPKNTGSLPDTVVLTGPLVAKLGYWDLKSLTCKLGYDHLGTVKLLTDHSYDCIKELFYDSFGNAVSETRPEVYFPFGFAGGLRDIATGFVRFGFRDYDPSVGRFTTPDPAKDTRGDGDIYDYCVDDPVNRMDAAGLAFTGSGNHEPVKLEPFKTDEQKGYWRTIPEEGACKKCLEMAKQRFTSRPERPHPNCKCEIEFVDASPKPDRLEDARENEEVAVVKERLLDIPAAEGVQQFLEKLNKSGLIDMKGVHQQLFFGDENIGFFADGKIQADLQEKLIAYNDTEIKYRAKYIREAVDTLKTEHMELLDMMERVNSMLNLDMEESDSYMLLVNNCQHFIQKVVKLAESYAQRDGVPLRVK